jgi:phosphoenolpyruvate-protein kinase (PTS system EI component)
MQTRLQFGLRGLRFSLVERRLFETQVQAIASLVDDHDVRILLPMVLGPDDFHEAVAVIEAAADQAGVSRRPPIGAMIETPAALLCLEDILEEAEFVSIGTNDLTQFMLAADRAAAERGQPFSVLHPSVLRAIKHVVEASAVAGRGVAVCGEAAGDPLTAELLVGLGIRHLSMSPLRAGAVRRRIRSIDSKQCRALANEAMSRGSARAVEQLIRETTNARPNMWS